MRKKNEVYKNEQLYLSHKIIEILNLNKNNQILLYDLDNDKNKQQQILDLVPELRKYFSFRNMVGVENPEKLKRPYMSIIRHITKLTHTITHKQKKITINHKPIVTSLYTFTEKQQ